MGQSLGSAPTVHLSITQGFKNIAALILISPLASGIKIISPEMSNDDLEKIDVFSNIKKVVDVICPIFILHGQKDDVIPSKHSFDLIKFMKNPYV